MGPGISNLLIGDMMVCPQTMLWVRLYYSSFRLTASGAPSLPSGHLCLALVVIVADSDVANQP